MKLILSKENNFKINGGLFICLFIFGLHILFFWNAILGILLCSVLLMNQFFLDRNFEIMKTEYNKQELESVQPSKAYIWSVSYLIFNVVLMLAVVVWLSAELYSLAT